MNDVNIELAPGKKISVQQILMFFIALLFGTYLRISFLLLYPFFVVFVFWIFKWKVERNAVFLFSLIAIGWVISLRHGSFIKYNLVSLYFFAPFILLLLASPPKVLPHRNNLKMLMNALSIVAIFNNIIGIVQYIRFPNDDSFRGVYGIFTVSQNGLVILNSMLFFYHLLVFQRNKKIKRLLLSLSFLFSLVMGFYGAGLIVLFASLVLTYFRMKMRNIILVASIVIFSGLLVVVLMRVVSPDTLEYNVNIVKKFLYSNRGIDVPRKLTVFKNYAAAYPSQPVDFLFGSGGGTFNSRSAFMVGSPTYFNLDFIKSPTQPYYFRTYAYTLWNDAINTRYDGFMSQPFTSLLALLGEYGLLFSAALFYVWLARFNGYLTLGNLYAKERNVRLEFRMYKFVTFFTILLIIIDNYIEYPEIIALLLIIGKLCQQQLKEAFFAGAD
jgi:hypothetical protein